MHTIFGTLVVSELSQDSVENHFAGFGVRRLTDQRTSLTAMSENEQKPVEKWINGKFDAKITVSLTRRGTFLNPSLSLINGKTYSTKLGQAMSVQLGLKEIMELADAVRLIADKMKEEHASRKVSETSSTQ